MFRVEGTVKMSNERVKEKKIFMEQQHGNAIASTHTREDGIRKSQSSIVQP
jgi:hypothetical protein